MTNFDLLTNAYKDDEFQKSLNNIRFEIEKEINKFIVTMKEDLNPTLRVFDNVESRIKSFDSFLEKIRRKEYINVWPITPNKESNIDLISTRLDDLIGYRINCFFKKDIGWI